MTRTASIIAIASLLGALSTPGFAQASRWGSSNESTVKFITASEAKWANSECSAQLGLNAVIADDFQGTSTDGHRYAKAAATATDPKPPARDCELGDVKVRFFGGSMAIAYGSESGMRKATDGTEAKRCQVWTDTWLRRNGKWQIVSAQDTIVPCHV